MARSRRKNGGPTRGRFKKKKLGKGFLANRRTVIGTRAVLRITDPDAAAGKAADSTAGGSAAKSKT